MAGSSSTGAKLYIASALPASFTSGACAALSYTEITGIEKFPDFGPTINLIKFTPAATGKVKKFAGSIDAGDPEFTYLRDPLDPGQIALIAAQDKFNHVFKVTVDDSADANDTDSVFYLIGKVFSTTTTLGGADDVGQRKFKLGVEDIIEVASVAV